MKTIVYRFLLLCLLTLGLPLQGLAAITAASTALPAAAQTMPVAAPCHAMPMLQAQPATTDTHCATPHAKADADCAQHASCCIPVVLPVATLGMPALRPAMIYSGYQLHALPAILPDTPEHPPKRFTPILA